jgi:hypothetical protein
MKKHTLISLLFMVILLLPLSVYGETHKGQKSITKKGLPSASGTGQAVVYSPMPDPGKKVPIGNGYYIVYGFDKKPKLGTVIMKVEIFTAEDNRDTSFEVKAHADMPSMKGAHVTVDRSFKLSRKGVYLAPLDIVMPGDWEARLTIIKDGKVFFRGRYNFNV